MVEISTSTWVNLRELIRILIGGSSASFSFRFFFGVALSGIVIMFAILNWDLGEVIGSSGVVLLFRLMGKWRSSCSCSFCVFPESSVK